MADEKETSQVRVEFEGDLLNKVNSLKKYYGILSSAELIRLLVNDRARQLNLVAQEGA